MYQVIDDRYICEVLSQYEKKEEDLRKEIQEMYSLLDRQTQMQDDAIQSASYHLNAFQLSADVKDVSSTVLVYQKLLKKHQTDIAEYISSLLSELDTIHRVMVCYYVLPTKDKKILEKFYCQDKEKYSIRVLELAKEFHLSETSIKRRRREALKTLKELYESNRSSDELLRLKTKGQL